MFVMCNAVDQTDLSQTAYNRIHKALGHAGPAITITSLTNALAFAFGALSSLEALTSFCLFATMCIIFLYIWVMTIFLSVVVWDTERVHKKQTECCNMLSCCCGEKNPICCCGVCTTPKQRRWAGIEETEAEKSAMNARREKASDAMKTTLEASATERCLGRFFAPYVLSTPGRIVFGIIYLVWLCVAIYGCSQLEVAFDFDYFISESSDVFTYNEANDKYFNTGGEQTRTYVENTKIDFTTQESQLKIQEFNRIWKESSWHDETTLDMWYADFLEEY